MAPLLFAFSCMSVLVTGVLLCFKGSTPEFSVLVLLIKKKRETSTTMNTPF